MIRVKATREGLPGGTTYSGYVVDSFVSFVALPSTRAVLSSHFIQIRNVLNGRQTVAQVLDVGPWNMHDDAYVFGVGGVQHRPQAETGRDTSGRATNGAGIDLGEKVWADLGMLDNGPVEWEFIVPEVST